MILLYNQIDAYKQYTMWCSCILQCAIVYYSYTSLCTIISDVMYVMYTGNGEYDEDNTMDDEPMHDAFKNIIMMNINNKYQN